MVQLFPYKMVPLCHGIVQVSQNGPILLQLSVEDRGAKSIFLDISQLFEYHTGIKLISLKNLNPGILGIECQKLKFLATFLGLLMKSL